MRNQIKKKERRIGKQIVAGVALGAAGLAALPAQATESGLGFYQTADIYAPGTFHFDYDTIGNGVKTDLGTSVGLEYGFGSGGDGVFGRNEVGFDYLVSGSPGNPFPSSTSDRISFNAKTQLYNNSDNGTRVSLGLSGLGKRATFNTVNLHLLGYKAFDFGRVHAGVFKNFDRDSGGDDSSGIQLGFDRTIGSKVIVGADFRSGDSGFLAPCIIYNMNDRAGFEIAIGRANDSAVSPRYQTYLAFDYSFDSF